MSGHTVLDRETVADLTMQLRRSAESVRAAATAIEEVATSSEGTSRACTSEGSERELVRLLQELAAAHRAACEVNRTLADLLVRQRGTVLRPPTVEDPPAWAGAKTRAASSGSVRDDQVETTKLTRERARMELQELRRELDRLPASARRPEWDQRWAGLWARVEQEQTDEETLRRDIQLLRSVVFSTCWAVRMPVGTGSLGVAEEVRRLPARPRAYRGGRLRGATGSRHWAVAAGVLTCLVAAAVGVLWQTQTPRAMDAPVGRTEARGWEPETGGAVGAGTPVPETAASVGAHGRSESPAGRSKMFVDEGMMFRCAVPAGWRATPVRSDGEESVTVLENGRGEQIWVVAHGAEWPPLEPGVDDQRELRRVTRRISEVTGTRWTYYVRESGWDARSPRVPVFGVVAEAVAGEQRRHVEAMHFREAGRDFLVAWIGPSGEEAGLARAVLLPFVMTMEPMAAEAVEGGESPFLRGIVAEAFGRSGGR